MNVARICLLLVTLGAIRLVLVGAGSRGVLVAIVGFALVLGFLDRRLRSHVSDRPASRQGAAVQDLAEDADEGSGAGRPRDRS